MRSRTVRKPVRKTGLLLSAEEALLTCAVMLKSRANFSVNQRQGRVLVTCQQGQRVLTDSYEVATSALQNELYGLRLRELV